MSTESENVTDKPSEQSVVHTPGPWEYVASVGVVRAKDDEMTVCEIKGWGYLTSKNGVAKATDEMDANGRLLAAAPDMLSALMECMAWFVSNEVTCIAMDDAKAAIEKATGEVV
jgi:hypothetical protein